jgi:CheY-like chemotaxis protein
MIGKKESPSNQPKEIVARHLRAADAYTKEGQYESALLEIQRALKLDPKNYYARSFQDRIRAELDRQQQKIAKKEQQQASDEEKKADAVSQLLRSADELIASKNYQGALKVVARVYQIDPRNYFASSYSDRIEILMTQEAEARQAPAVASPTPSVKPPVSVSTLAPGQAATVPVPQQATKQAEAPSSLPAKNERASLVMYRQMLREMWFDGKITAEEEQELKKVRQMFNISQQDHLEAEKQVHIEAYVDALKTAWRDGVISSTENEVLQLMRQKFSISMEEHLSAETQILWAKQNKALTKGTIFIVDDDRTMLLSLAASLKKHGYDVLTAENIENGIKLLERTMPMLILSDLMFGAGEMTGLEFYQHVRNTQEFREIPFLLMSGISDEFVVRAGKRMGVDDFLTKPFSLELLLATIEGKLRSVQASPTPAA